MKFLLILCEVIILGATNQVNAQLSDKFYIRHLAPPEGPGYDLFYYDGISLRDEKWRFDYANRDTAVHRRFGLKDKQSSQFHVVDTLSDANGFRQKSRILSDPASIESLLAMGVDPPTTLDTFQKYGTVPRLKSRDNSDQEGQPRDPTFGFLNGVTLGVTLNRPTTPGDSYIQGFVSTGLGAQNNRPGLQFGIPNLGILPGSRPTDDSPIPMKSPFNFPFFGNNGGPPPPQSAPPPPPLQAQSGLFGLPFGNRDPPPPLAQPSPSQQPNFFAGFQNLNIPFIGQPQTTTTTTESIIPATNPSLFANFPNFGFQNNNKPTTAIVTTTSTPGPQRPFGNLQFPFTNFGQTTATTTVAPETTTTAQHSFGFNLPIISGLFQNNNGKGVDKNVDNRFSPPGHSQGHRHPPKHPQNHQQKHPHRKPSPSSPQYQNEGGQILLEPGVSEQSPTTTEKVMGTSHDYKEYFPASEDVTQKLAEVLTSPPYTTPPTGDKLVTGSPIETGLLESNAVEPSTDPDIPSPIQKPFVESLVAVVDKNSYALGIHETSTNSFSNVEPVKPFSIPPVSSSRSDDLEQTTFVYIPADSLLPKVIDKITTTDNVKILIDENQNTDEIISDINDLSNNPPFPTVPSAIEESPPNALPFPLLDLVPPFETKPGDLGIHEDLTLSKISTPESSNAAIPVVPGIIELIRQSKQNISNEILIQTESPLKESNLLNQDFPSSTVETKSNEINGINSLEQKSSVLLPDVDILPPFENDKGSVLLKEKTNTILVLNTTATEGSTGPNIADAELSNVIPPEIDLLPPFDTNLVSDQEQNKTVIVTTTNIPNINKLTSTTPNVSTVISALPPEIDLLPPFNRAPVMDVVETITLPIPTSNVNTTRTTTTTHTTMSTIIPRIILAEVNNLIPPEIDLLPPFEGNLVPGVIKNELHVTTNTPIPTTTTTTTSRITISLTSIPVPNITLTAAAPPIVSVNNITAPEIDLLPPFQSIPVADVEEISLASPVPKVGTSQPMTIQLPTTASIIKPPISSSVLNNVIPPETDLLPPFEENTVPDVIKIDQSITTTNTPMTTSTTSTTSRTITSSTGTSIPKITLTTVAPLVLVNIKNVTAPEIDVLPPFQSIPIADKEKVTLAVTKNVNTPTTTTMKSLTTTSATRTRFNSGELNKVIPPGTDLLPPFEGNPVQDVAKTTTTSTTTSHTTTSMTSTAAPKIKSTTASLSLVLVNQKNVTSPENDLLPPFQSIHIADVEEITTIMPKSRTTAPATTSRISSNELNNVIPPEIDLLPPFVGNIVLNKIEKITNKPTSNIPTTKMAKTTSRTTTSSSTTIFSPTTVAPPVVLVNLENVIVPEIDLLPPFEGIAVSDVVLRKESSSSTTNRPKPPLTTTTSSPQVTFKITDVEAEKVPEIDLLPPFETTIFRTQPTTTSSTITTTPRMTTNKILVTKINTTLKPNINIRLPEIDLLPPLESNKATTENLFSTSTIRTTTMRTTNSPITTTQNIPKTTVTTKPRIVTDKKVEPIYQRTTTISPIKHPEITTTTTALQIPTTVVKPVLSEIKSRVKENQVLENVPRFDGSNFNQLANETNILLLISNTTTTTTPSAIVPSVGTRTITNTTTTTIPRITKVTKPSTTKSTTSNTTEKLMTVVLAKPSKFFLPPFETPVYKLELNTSFISSSDRLNASTTAKTSPQLEESTIRTETDKIVDSVRKIIEQTSQSVLPTVHTDFTSEPRTVTLTPTSRLERSSTTSARLVHTKPAVLRTAPQHEGRHNKHKFHSHIRHPDTRLIPPPRLNPGQVDVYDLGTHITQGGQNLNGPFIYSKLPDRDLLPPFYPNLGEMHASPVVPSPQQPTATNVPMFSVVDTQMTTKAGVKRPVFVNVEDENDMETTTSILDIKLSPNAIKSLIG